MFMFIYFKMKEWGVKDHQHSAKDADNKVASWSKGKQLAAAVEAQVVQMILSHWERARQIVRLLARSSLLKLSYIFRTGQQGLVFCEGKRGFYSFKLKDFAK